MTMKILPNAARSADRRLATTGKALLCASTEGQPALCPGSLALICAMQYMANLSDRGAVEAVAARIDWKYTLGLELTDSSFDSSVLSLFRSRLLNGGKEKLILDKLIERCQQLQLIKAKGKARTDSDASRDKCKIVQDRPLSYAIHSFQN